MISEYANISNIVQEIIKNVLKYYKLDFIRILKVCHSKYTTKKRNVGEIL